MVFAFPYLSSKAGSNFIFACPSVPLDGSEGEGRGKHQARKREEGDGDGPVSFLSSVRVCASGAFGFIRKQLGCWACEVRLVTLPDPCPSIFVHTSPAKFASKVAA